MEALLRPDYTDEEIRREVHHYGVSLGSDGALGLEEKGTVYNEMVSSSARPGNRLWHGIDDVLYGSEHPLARSAGGDPDQIREMTPDHIRTFHRDHYQLGNMGMVGAFPSEMPATDVLARMDATLVRLQPDPTPDAASFGLEDLPAPRSATPGALTLVDYPTDDLEESGQIALLWPPTRELPWDDQLLLDQFLSTFAGSEASNLYKRLVGASTREIDIGATSASAWSSDDLGQPVYVWLSGVTSDHLTEADVRDVRVRVLDELSDIAAWQADDPALIDFNRRLLSGLVATERGLRDFVNSPPGFGIRGTGEGWYHHLLMLSRSGETRRSVTRRTAIEQVRAAVATAGNPWTQRLVDWELLGVEPYGFATRPSPTEMARLDADRDARLAGEVAALRAAGSFTDDQEALRAFQARYDADTATLDALVSDVPMPKFVDDPPLTLDDALHYAVRAQPTTGIPVVASTFDGMSGAHVGLALDLQGVPEAAWLDLAMLGSLVSEVGVVQDGVAIPYTEMFERLQNETLDLSAWVSTDDDTGRIELVVSGTGTNLEETRAAVAWMRRVLYGPDWRTENLPRLRDLVSEQLTGLRHATSSAEENWVNDPAHAWREQGDPLLYSVDSFLTTAHQVHRIRWRLMDADSPAARAEAVAFLRALAPAAAGLDRPGVVALVAALRDGDPRTAALSPGARAVALEALDDLDASLADLPDATLASDWSYLCRQMAADLAMTPEAALAELEAVRQQILRTGNARLWVVGSTANLAALDADLLTLTAGLSREPVAAPAARAPRTPILDRLRDHASVDRAVYVGLVMPDLRGGVFLNSAPGAGWTDVDRESQLRYLTGLVYGGGGAHSLFMRTWGAGLAYSNGVRSSVDSGRVNYYAERCPELTQTLRFVIEEMRAAETTPDLAEYAVAQAFSSRAAGSYESRGSAIAFDLADGDTPEVVRAFRSSLLALRADPTLVAQLQERIPSVYGAIMPGFGASVAGVEGGSYMVIGTESHLRDYEAYLQSVDGPETRVHRLYPRDYWIPAPL
jgi:hypothetical protein